MEQGKTTEETDARHNQYLAVLGRQPEISLAELEALDFRVTKIIKSGDSTLALIEAAHAPQISRLGGTQKLAVKLTESPLDYLASLPAGKITFGISDYSLRASLKGVNAIALKFKRALKAQGRSVRIVDNKTPILSNATTLHNGLGGQNPRKVELIHLKDAWYQVIGIQDIDAYARRDQARPARDAKVGMLPPKLAQILINLCGPLPSGSLLLDPFCGTGVVLQEALLMGYSVYGTDLSPRMIKYTDENIRWLLDHYTVPREDLEVFLDVGDAADFTWTPSPDAVACECYLGAPMSQIPTEIRLKAQMQECKAIILGFLKNLMPQVRPGTPVVIAIPAWLRQEPVRPVHSSEFDTDDSLYQRLEILDEIEKLSYNVDNKSRQGLLYHRKGQIVARDIIILRKT